MMPSHSTYGPLMSSNPMAYVISNPIANSVLNNVTKQSPSSNQPSPGSPHDLQDQLARLQELNQTLSRKLHTKTAENQKLSNKIEKLSEDAATYKNLIENIQQAMINGSIPSISANIQQSIQIAIANSKSKISKPKKYSKKQGKDCQCCYSAEKPYVCTFEGCNKRFRAKAHLEAHGNVHSGRRFVCEYPSCGKSFCRKYNLVEHAKMHLANNPNQCNYQNCGKVFSSHYGLQRHQQAQHNLSNLTKFTSTGTTTVA